MYDLVLGHTSFLGHTGYANHAREFFCALNKLIPVRIRNFAHVSDVGYLTEAQNNMIIEQQWGEPPWKVGAPFTPPDAKKMVDLLLVETNHYYFYDQYQSQTIAYNVWESTRQPEAFFKRLLDFDQFWAPSEWQARCTIEQGFPESRVKVVPEGVDSSVFHPIMPEQRNQDKFRFLLFGRWDYRKATREIIQAFLDTFEPDENVELVCSIDNAWPTPDGLTDTDARLKEYGFYGDPRLNIVHFVPFAEYVNYLQNGHVFLSCARSEGWNLPLIESIACGIPSICSNYGAQLEFAQGVSSLVNIIDHKPVPANIFVGQDVPGTWAEPDFGHLRKVMREMYENYEDYVTPAIRGAKEVAEKFTWESAAQKAYKHIEELYDSDSALVDTRLKLNLGCGNEKLPGYVNIDLYGEPDEKHDARQLPYGLDSVDVIYSSHMLEHLGHRETEGVLSHWLGLLKYGGELELHIPNLEWNVTNWLRADKEERKGFALHQIFGHQAEEGEVHKTGFTHGSIKDLLEDVGYGEVVTEPEWTHAQECIKVTAKKRTTAGREIVVMSSFPDTHEKETILRECFCRIKGAPLPVALVTHHKPRPELTELFDYVIYERENILSTNWDLSFWHAEPEHLRILGRYGNGSYQPVAIMSSLRMAVSALKDRYDTIYFVESDVMTNFVEYLGHTRKAIANGAKMVGFDYVGNNDFMRTNIIAFDTKWADKLLPDLRSWEEYLDINDQMMRAGVHSGNAIFEFWFPDWFKYKNAWDRCYIHPPHVRDAVIVADNVIKRELAEKTRVDLSETSDGRIVVFFLNTNDAGELVECKVLHKTSNSEREVFKTTLQPYIASWFVIPKELSMYDVYLNDKKTQRLNIDPKLEYLDTTFKFYRDELVCKSWSGGEFGPTKEDINIAVGFVGGTKVELSGTSQDEYLVEFIDTSIGNTVHAGRIKSGYWIAPSRHYVIEWLIKVSNNDECLHEARFEPEGQKVLLSLDSKSLGDTIAWFPYTVEFARARNCKIVVSTFWNDLFRDAYPTVEFVEPGSVVNNLYASFAIGCYDDDATRNKLNWRTIPIQRIASDLLNLPASELKPKLGMDTGKRTIKEKYVCISEHSTMQAKAWNYPDGWQIVVDHLRSLGYEVVVISRESTQLRGVRRRTGKSIEETVKTLAHAEAFLGVSSGPAWLAWALNIPVVMVSGISEAFNEFTTGMERVINEDVCHGCANDPEYPYDRGDWTWCPREREFECTRSIEPQQVIEAFDRLLSAANKDEPKLAHDMFYTPDQPEPIHLAGITGPPTFGYSYEEIFNMKAYEYGKCKIEPGDVVVDCGANIGVFARYAFERGAKEVYSLEPEPENYAALVRNSNGAQVWNVAVSDKKGTARLHLHSCRGGHSLIDNNINHTQLNRSVDVPTITLPEVLERYDIKHVDYLKVDTEGSELAIFNGCPDEVLLGVDKIAMEYHNMLYDYKDTLRTELIARLNSLGFESMLIFLNDAAHLQMMYFWR